MGVPDARLVFFRANEATIHDTWRVAGLRGTGSHDIEVTNCFVPDRRVMRFSDRPWPSGPMWKMPIFSLLLPVMAAVSLGIARAAVDEFSRLAQRKARNGKIIAEREGTQTLVATAEAAIRSARAFLFDALEELWGATLAGIEPPLRDRALLRLAVVNASAMSMRAVDLVYEAAGGSSVYNQSPLQRQFRDVHVASHHVVLAADGFVTAGRVLLGYPPDSPLL